MGRKANSWKNKDTSGFKNIRSLLRLMRKKCKECGNILNENETSIEVGFLGE